MAELGKSTEAQSEVTAVQTQTTDIHGDATQTVTSASIQNLSISVTEASSLSNELRATGVQQ